LLCPSERKKVKRKKIVRKINNSIIKPRDRTEGKRRRGGRAPPGIHFMKRQQGGGEGKEGMLRSHQKPSKADGEKEFERRTCLAIIPPMKRKERRGGGSG